VASIWLPSLLAQEAGGIRRHEVEASTVRDALAALPVRDLLIDELGRLRPLVHVYVDGEREHDLYAPVGQDTRLIVVTAVAGGSR
jgi:hypothetical protein